MLLNFNHDSKNWMSPGSPSWPSSLILGLNAFLSYIFVPNSCGRPLGTFLH